MRKAARARRRGSAAPPSDDPRKAIQHGLRLLSRSARSEHDLRERLEARFTAEAATGEHHDDRAALAAARIALRRLARGGGGSDAGGDPTRSRRLVAALARRGFDPGTIERVRAHLRREHAHEAASVTP